MAENNIAKHLEALWERDEDHTKSLCHVVGHLKGLWSLNLALAIILVRRGIIGVDEIEEALWTSSRLVDQGPNQTEVVNFLKGVAEEATRATRN